MQLKRHRNKTTAMPSLMGFILEAISTVITIVLRQAVAVCKLIISSNKRKIRRIISLLLDSLTTKRFEK